MAPISGGQIEKPLSGSVAIRLRFSYRGPATTIRLEMAVDRVAGPASGRVTLPASTTAATYTVETARLPLNTANIPGAIGIGRNIFVPQLLSIWAAVFDEGRSNILVWDNERTPIGTLRLVPG